MQAAIIAISEWIEGEGGLGTAILNSIAAGMAGLGTLLLSILRGAVELMLGFISGVFAVDVEAALSAAFGKVTRAISGLFGGTDEPESEPEGSGPLDKVLNFVGLGGGDESPLPVAPAEGGAAAAIPGSRTSHINMEITNNIEAQGTTTEELAKNLDPVMRQHMNTIVENPDSQLRL